MMPPTSIDGTDITGATIDGTDVQEITVDGDTVFTAVPAGAFDITQFSLDRTETNILSGNPMSMHLVDSDTKIYTVQELGRGNNPPFREFTMPSPNDFANATLNNTFFLGQGGKEDPKSFAFRPDGTSFYVGRNSTGLIRQFDLTTPFDVTTASQSASLSVGGTSGVGIARDGTKIYHGDGNGNVESYALSTAFDLSTAGGVVNSFNASLSGFSPWDIRFNLDGSRIFLADLGTELVQYDLTTNYDISTATNRQTNVLDGLIRYFSFNSDGTILINGNNGDIQVYTL